MEFTGKVDLVGVAADPNSRTYTAKIEVPNGKLRLKAGMIAEASIETSGTVNVVTIPGETIVHDPQGITLVYVRYAEVRKDRTFSTSRPNVVIINVELEDWANAAAAAADADLTSAEYQIAVAVADLSRLSGAR